MSKKTLIILAVLVLLGVGGVTGYFVLNGRSSKETGGDRSVSLLPKTSKDEVNADTLYEDSAGFSFKYPKNAKVTDVTPNGDEYYTQLNLTKGSEKVIITLKDTSTKTIEDWLKGDTVYSGASLVGAASLDGVSAKQYTKGEKLITVAVDGGVIYLIEGLKDDGFWENVQGSIVSTFKFAGAANASNSSSGASDVIYEEEEVIE